MVFESATRSDIDLRRDLYSSVVLSGGSTNLNGFAKRLKWELDKRVPISCKVRVVECFQDNMDPSIMSWIGGSILASLACFQQKWLSKVEYDECGPSVTSGRKRF